MRPAGDIRRALARRPDARTAAEQRAGLRPPNVGIAALLTLFALVWLGFTKELPWAQHHELRMVFRSAAEIRPNSPVRIAGVEVGKVSSIEPGPGTTAVVTARIQDRGLPIHRDAVAKIRPRIFLEGNFFIDLAPGSPGAPELPEGGTIPVVQTATPVQLDQILGTLQSDQRRRLRGALGQLATAARSGAPEAFNRSIPLFEPAFKGTARTFDGLLGSSRHDLANSIRSQARVAEALARNRPQLGSLVSSFARVSAALADRQRELAATVAGLDGVVREAGPSLARLNAALPETRALIRDLRPGLRRAPPTLDAAQPVAKQARGLLGRRELPALVHEARPTVASLAGFAPDATRLFAKLDAPVGCLLKDALPILLSPVEDPPLSTGEPVYRELLYAFVGLSSAAQNFDGNGFAVRYHAGEGDQVVSTGVVPGLGEALYGTQARPLIGSRPAFTNSLPPFRPASPCQDQARPDLHARLGAGGMTPTGARARRSPLVRTGGTPQQVLARLHRAGVSGARKLRRWEKSLLSSVLGPRSSNLRRRIEETRR